MKRRTRYRIASDAISRISSIQNLHWLADQIQARIQELEDEAAWEAPDGAVETRSVAQSHLTLEPVKCGKENCRCAHGKLHGPYWYLYTYVGNQKYKKTYIGKKVK